MNELAYLTNRTAHNPHTMRYRIIRAGARLSFQTFLLALAIAFFVGMYVFIASFSPAHTATVNRQPMPPCTATATNCPIDPVPSWMRQ